MTVMYMIIQHALVFPEELTALSSQLRTPLLRCSFGKNRNKNKRLTLVQLNSIHPWLFSSSTWLPE